MYGVRGLALRRSGPIHQRGDLVDRFPQRSHFRETSNNLSDLVVVSSLANLSVRSEQVRACMTSESMKQFLFSVSVVVFADESKHESTFTALLQQSLPHRWIRRIDWPWRQWWRHHIEPHGNYRFACALLPALPGMLSWPRQLQNSWDLSSGLIKCKHLRAIRKTA